MTWLFVGRLYDVAVCMVGLYDVAVCRAVI